jgi:hypothetical protein
MRGERIPLAVDEDAAQVEHVLGAASAPSHPWTIEPHTDEVADSAREMEYDGHMGWLRVAIALIAWLYASTMGVAWADAPLKIASVSEGSIKLTVGEDASELRRNFRLAPQGVDQVRIDHVRLVDCVHAHGQSCTSGVETSGCAADRGCVLTALEPGPVTAVVRLPTPGTYTSSLAIVYLKEDKLPDGKVQTVKAVLTTTLEVARPAPAVLQMKVTVAGPTGAETDLGWSRRGDAIMRLRAQDDDGASRTPAQGWRRRHWPAVPAMTRSRPTPRSRYSRPVGERQALVAARDRVARDRCWHERGPRADHERGVAHALTPPAIADPDLEEPAGAVSSRRFTTAIRWLPATACGGVDFRAAASPRRTE